MPTSEVAVWADSLRDKYGIPAPVAPGTDRDDDIADFIWELGKSVLEHLFGDDDHLPH